ncbi:type II toxin-antitoxin system VapC family toxin [Candidatus Bathyarchaeota archaeon]|nr:type II toxin-antitoxin system VapC family toxin [Candidatus Bathyarchaeota archaeon]
MNLFDSSAIINLCGEKKLDKLLEGWTLSLTFYELGNAIWKQVYLYKAIEADEARIALDSLIEVFNRLKKLKPENALKILKMALEEGITYYDASYIQAAIDNNLTLVTDDSKLYKIGKKYVKTVASDEL